MSRTTANNVLSRCAAEVGYREGSNNYNKYAAPAGHANYQAWCATFLVAEFNLAGQELPSGANTASCWLNCQAFKRVNRFSWYPAVGAIFFLGASGSEHTGIVYRYDSTYVYTYEGNTNNNGSPQGNGVYARKRTRRSIYGYGYPNYSDPIISADPQWGGHNSGGTNHSGSSAFPGAGYFGPGANNKYVTELGTMLIKRGGGRFYDVGAGPRWTAEADGAATSAFQKAQGWSGTDANGIPGPTTWDFLKTGKGNDIPKVGGKPKPPPKARPWIWGTGPWNNSVRTNTALVVQRALKKEVGLDYSSGPGYFGPLTQAAYSEWQRKLGYRGLDANGIPGKTSLEKLGDKYGFDVRWS